MDRAFCPQFSIPVAMRLPATPSTKMPGAAGWLMIVMVEMSFITLTMAVCPVFLYRTVDYVITTKICN